MHACLPACMPACLHACMHACRHIMGVLPIHAHVSSYRVQRQPVRERDWEQSDGGRLQPRPTTPRQNSAAEHVPSDGPEHAMHECMHSDMHACMHACMHIMHACILCMQAYYASCCTFNKGNASLFPPSTASEHGPEATMFNDSYLQNIGFV